MTDDEARDRLREADLRELHAATVAFRKASDEARKRLGISLGSGGSRARKRADLAQLQYEQTGALVRSARASLFRAYLGEESPVIVDHAGNKLVFFYEPVTRTWDTIIDDPADDL